MSPSHQRRHAARSHPPGQAAPPDQGLSLIELVLAMAIFALVAVMGTQALTGMIRMREDLAHRSDKTAALAEMTSLLRGDLNALVPMLFYPPQGAAPQAALRFVPSRQGAVLSLSRGGSAQFVLGTAPPARAGIKTGRVEWHWRDGQLSRSFWPSLIPADPRSRLQTGPEFGTALGGIEGLRLRSYWPQIGWVDGPQAPGLAATSITADASDADSGGAASEVYSDSLPLAIELTLVTGDFGEISLVESLR